ncbi:MAG TPA: DUF1569 domain-containing protein [Vicinamibacterales bacterium]|nr:DUF1569 domain-containing protein [Vicinamibacterales bacterium]
MPAAIAFSDDEFSHRLTASNLKGIVRTLARDRWTADILRRLKTLRPDAAPRWGRMSAHQMVCHLADGCRMALGEKVVRDASPRFPVLVRWIALYTPLRWRAGIPTTPEIDQERDGTRPHDFAADVAQVERLVRAMVARPRGHAWPRHPYFGRMSRRAWLRWGYVHTDHHLRQFGA